MADTMTCPLCGQEHPASTTYCTSQWTEIPAAPRNQSGTEPAVEQPVATCPFGDHEHPVAETYCERFFSPLPGNWLKSPTASTPTPLAGQVPCPGCGLEGMPGAECQQCGFDELPQPSSAQTASLRLPSGQSVPIPRGCDVVIGRQSDIGGIRQGLEPFDAVSRRHCYVRISLAGNEVSVRDPGSANRTWVGDNPAEVEADETRTAPLPVRLRLGQQVSITISTEGTGA